MSDDTIEPRIMASSTVRPTLVVAPSTRQASAHAPELTPGVSTAEEVTAVVVGMTWKAARKLLEPRGFIVRSVTGEDDPSEPPAPNGERANLTIIDGMVARVALA